MVTALPPPPGPRSPIPGGPMLAFRRDPIGLLTRLSHPYGDVVRYRLGVSASPC